MNRFRKHKTKSNHLEQSVFMALGIAFVFVCAVIFTWMTARHVDRKMRLELFQKGRLIQLSVETSKIDSLSGSIEDIRNPEYHELKKKLAKGLSLIPECKFIYLMGQNSQDSVFFFVDSEPEGSEDESLPGSVYPEASDLLKEVFVKRKENIEGPFSDRWGTFITVLIPIHSEKSKDKEYVLGVDVDASDWNAAIARECALPVFLAISTLLFGLLIFKLRRTNKISLWALEDLKYSENQFKAIFENAPVGILRYNFDGLITQSNSHLANIMGSTPEKIVGMNLFDLKNQQVVDAVKKSIDSKTSYYEGDYVSISGNKSSYIRATFTAINDDIVFNDGFIGIIEDFSERRKAEKLIEENEAFQKILIDSMAVGILIIDPKTRQIENINTYGVMMFGDEKENIIGNKCHSFICPSSEGQCPICDMKTNVDNAEKMLRRKDGSLVPILKSVKSIKINGVEKLLESFVDLSLQKEAEEAAKVAHKAKTEFLANMSHEIRTPLNGVIGFTDLLRKTELNEMQIKFINTVQNSARSLMDLINDVLDFSKMEAGKLLINIEKVDLFNLCVQIMETIQLKADESKVEFLFSYSSNVPKYVWTDPIRVRQVLINLLGNAVKFTDEGEIEFSVDAEFNEKEPDKVQLTFTVRDTGIGIAPEKQVHIFDSFTQADNSTNRKYGGTGLGLTISDNIVKKLGSKLNVSSRPGSGSRFMFSLNVLFETEENQFPTELKSFERVLIVDDNLKSSQNLQRALNQFNIKSKHFSDGLQALDFLSFDSDFDAYFIDYSMPLINGIEVVGKMSTLLNKKFNELPVIFLLKSTEMNLSIEARNIFSVWINKPLNKESVAKSLIKLFGKGHAIEKLDGGINDNLIYSSPNLMNYSEYKFLVVDDNPINNMLTTSIIQYLFPGAVVHEAENGVQAIELYKKHDFDMIFLDVQMPEKNGYETATEIREIEKETQKNIPIIAITAGTVIGEKERCLQAGMNEYLTKPIVSDSLKQYFEKYLNRNGNRVNYESFDKIALYKNFSNDEELCKQLVKTALESLPQYVFFLKQSIELSNFSQVHVNANTVKGIAQNVYFIRLAEIAKQIEEESKKKSQNLGALYNQFEAEFHYLKEMLVV